MRPLATADLTGLRPHGGGFGGSPSEGPWVVRVDPADGAAGVLGDAPVVVTLSHPVAVESLGERTVRVWEGLFPAAGHITLSPDACVVIWSPARPLRAREHVLEVFGLRDRRGRDVRPHRSAFTVGHRSLDDLLQPTGQEPAG